MLFLVQTGICASRLVQLKRSRSASLPVYTSACLTYSGLVLFLQYAADPVRFYMDNSAVSDAVRGWPRPWCGD